MSWIRSKNMLLLMISIVLSLLISEAVVRYFNPQTTYSEMIKKIGSYYAPSEKNTFTIRKNYSGHLPTADGRGLASVTTNSEGFRSTKEPETNSSNILVIGDSYTFGVYVNDSETYPSIIEQSLNLPENYRVINAGYTSGHETDQQYSWFHQNFAKLKPKVVVWGVFLGNDILGINPNFWSKLNSAGLPLEYVNPNIYVDEFGVRRSKEFNPLNTINAKSYYKVPVLREMHLWILAGKAFARAKEASTKTNKTYKNKSSLGYIASHWNHIYGTYSDEFVWKEELFLQLLNSAKQTCEKNECKFVVALHPINFMVHPELMAKVIPSNQFSDLEPLYYKRLGTKLKEKNINYIDIHEHMIATSEIYFPNNGEVHYDLNGHKFAGELIANYLKKNFSDSLINGN